MSHRSRLKKELLVAAVLLSVGLILLPIAIYWVGQQVVGEYESPAGFLGLLGDIWSDFLNLDLGAWLLILSPYVTIQLARIAFKLMQGRTNVTQVTDSREFP
jgi:hypothetical protein